MKRIGDILDLPRAPLAARFGADLLRQLDRALGREDEPLSPRLPVAPYIAERNFHEPIAREEDVLATVERLAARLKTTLTARGDGARRVELALFRTDGAVKRIAAGTSRPVRDPQAIRALFVERLAALGDEIDPGFGFDLARLSVLVAEPCPDEQIGLGGAEDQADLDRLVDRLSARLGRRRVSRLVAHDSHIPELAAAAVPAQASTGRARLGRVPPLSRRGRLERAALRLLAKPEPIEDVVALVPDGPPVRFRWRRALHEVVAAEGPERIEGAWWSEQGGPGARLFPRRGQSRPALLAVPRRPLSRHGAWPACRAGSCTGCMRDAPLSRIRRRLEFLVPARGLASRGADAAGRAFGLAGLGLCDRNSVAGVVRAHLIKREQKLALAYHPGARLVFADGTPDILAYPRDRAAWGRLCRLLTRGNLRAEKGECILYLDDLLEHIDGLELIVMERSTWELASLPFLRKPDREPDHSEQAPKARLRSVPAKEKRRPQAPRWRAKRAASAATHKCARRTLA